jgi:fibronectin-binding autotransporter adhesin
MQSELLKTCVRAMRSSLVRVAMGFVLMIASATGVHAQRQMENLGRGVVAVRSSASAAYIGWRLLATDPDDIGFNIYRSQNGAAAVKLNVQPLTNTTDFVDSTATLTVSNAWFVRPVSGGVELNPSLPFGVPANTAVPVDFQNKVGPYLSIPLQPIPGGNYYTHHAWPGDLDGDGEYDFAISRLPNAGGVCLLDAYLRDGTFLWRMNMGYNSTNQDGIEPGASVLSIGHSDHATVYDLDGDGYAEVIVKTAAGVTVTNAAGVQVASISAPNDVIEYVSVLDGRTGVERARATVPNPYAADGPLSAHMGILYADGIHPSIVLECINRQNSGAFNLIITTWDFRDGQLYQRWAWTPPNDGKNYARGHQIRIADVDNDGRDEFCEIGFVLRDHETNAVVMFSNEILHGDRYHIADLDPDRPGLETFAVQQDNPNLLATAIFDSATGTMLKKWFSASVVDVGRGNAGDVSPTVRGVEVWSTQPNLYSAQGDFVSSGLPASCNFSLWWDADLLREQLDDGKIDKYGVGRVLSPYNMQGSALDALSTWRNAQPLYGDLFGDWREEVLFESVGNNNLIIFTPVTPATNRLVCLAQDPEYRECLTVKGYMQSTWPSYYIGTGMARPPVQPISDADLVWRGDGAINDWDGATANWFTNNLWVSNNTATVFVDGQSVLFDRSGSNNLAIQIVGTLMPGAVKVHTATDYTFTGGTLDGGMTFTKAGAGKLTLNNSNTFTGRTLVGEGLMLVNGGMPFSPVIVRGGTWLNGRIGGSGSVGAGVTIEFGGGVSPGQGTNSPGTLVIGGGLVLRGGTLNDFDLSDDPSGATGTNDLLSIVGNLTLQGTNRLVIRKLDAALPPGTYMLITYSGALIGGLNNLIVDGLDGVPVALTNPPGAIALIVKSTRPPTAVTWAGGPGGNWDLVTSSNWWNGGTKDWFVPQDTARFDNLGATSSVVNLAVALPVAGVVVDSGSNYTFTGSGRITGPGGLTKTNSGRLVVLTQNDYTGRTVVGGGTLEVAELNTSGTPGPLGSTGVSPTNLVFHGGTFRITSGTAYTDRGLTLTSGATTIDVPASGGIVNLAGLITGSGTLTKTGVGTLILGGANTYSGTIVSGGALQLGSAVANTSGLGSASVTVTNGGVLSLFGAGGGDLGTGGAGGPFVNSLVVPAGASGSFNVPFRISINNALTGSGTLNVGVTGVRGDFGGNWSAFAGSINIGSLTGTSDFRCNNSAGYPNAKINLGVNATFQNRVSGTPTIPVGELSGAAGSIVNAPGGNGGIGVVWRVGGLNTTATFAGNTFNNVGFIKEGSGTWIWTGTNTTHTSLTTVNAGTLQIGKGGTSGMLGPGNVANNATLAFNRADSITDLNYGVISGPGTLAKRGAGRLALTRAHTYSGPTTVETGTLAVTNAGSIAGSANIIISAGALFDVSGAAGGLMTLASGKMISGVGAVKGNFVVGSGAILAPGNSIGTLTFSNTLSLASGCTSFFEISKSPTTNDVVRVIGALTSGGTLVVTNVSANGLAAGDTFKLFNAGSYSGSFGAFVLPGLPNTLAWDTSTVNTDGILKVIVAQPPVISSVTQLGDGNARLTFSGTAYQPYEIRASTNLGLTPITDWALLGSGVFAGSAVVFDDLQATNFSQRFYLIRIP